MNNRFWTDKEIEILQEMAENKCSLYDACRVLKSRTKNAISQKAADLHLSFTGGEPEIDFEAFKKIIKSVRNPECV